MAEKFLNGAEVGAVREEVRGEGVTHRMRMQVPVDVGDAHVFFDDAPDGALDLALVAVQGERDEVVAPINAVQLARQYLVLNRRLAPETLQAGVLPEPDAQTTTTLTDGRTMTTTDYRNANRILVRLIRVANLGHAWSGGDPALPYNDPHPPDASGLLAEFVIEQIRYQRASRRRRFAWLSWR